MSAFRICAVHFCGFDSFGAIGKNVCRIFFATGSIEIISIRLTFILGQDYESDLKC